MRAALLYHFQLELTCNSSRHFSATEATVVTARA